MTTYVRFEHGSDDVPWLTLGPFDWLQMTYSSLRAPPDGEVYVAHYSGGWALGEEVGMALGLEGTDDMRWSDFVLFADSPEHGRDPDGTVEVPTPNGPATINFWRD